MKLTDNKQIHPSKARRAPLQDKIWGMCSEKREYDLTEYDLPQSKMSNKDCVGNTIYHKKEKRKKKERDCVGNTKQLDKAKQEKKS